MKKLFYLLKLHLPTHSTVSVVLILSILTSALFTGCTRRISTDPLISTTDLFFDTIIQITLYENPDASLSGQDAQSILEEAHSLCGRYEKMFSKTVPESDIYQLNHADGKPVLVHAETYDLIEQSINYSRNTNGLVDITVSKVKDLWDFSTQDTNAPDSAIPSETSIKNALSHVDYHNILLDADHQTVTLTDPEAAIDLGFIAKGYIADRLKEFLISKGVQSAIINLGGNVAVIGSKPDGSPFVVGIEKPFSDGDYMDKLSVTAQSVVTSGIYERFFEVNQTIYHHIIDPKTGYPVKTDLLSATIISDSSTQADALSTTCILLGKDKALDFLRQYPDVSAIFITDQNKIIKYPDK